MDISYWSWLGTAYLLYLAYKDHKNNMIVDDRKNWFMLGLSISLYSHFSHSILYIIATLGIGIGFRMVALKISSLGEADTNAIWWSILGFIIINPFSALAFSLVLILLMLVYMGIKRLMFKIPINEPTPFISVITASFAIICFSFGLYAI